MLPFLAFAEDKGFIRNLAPTLWLDASGSQLSAAAVASWSDGAITFTQGTGGDQPTYSLPTGRFRRGVDFVSDDKMQSVSTVGALIDATDWTAFVVYQTDAEASDGPIISEDSANTWTLQVNSDEDFVVTSGTGSVTITADTSLTLATAIYDHTALGASVNGGAVTWAAGTSATLTNVVDLGTDGTDYMDGRIFEIIVFDKVLHTHQIRRIQQYLADKHGVTLTGTSDFNRCDQYIRSLTPTLWLDAGDGGTVTQAAGKVSAWASRVGAITFTQATAGNQPSWGGQGITFDGAASPDHDYLASTATTGDVFANNAKSICVVQSTVDVNTSQIIIGDDATYWMLQTHVNKFALENYDGSGDYLDGAGASNGVTYVFCAKHTGGNLDGWQNGTAAVQVASGNTAVTTNIITVGSRTAGGLPWAGTLKEAILDNTAWTDDQFARVRSCLGAKYGITF